MASCSKQGRGQREATKMFTAARAVVAVNENEDLDTTLYSSDDDDQHKSEAEDNHAASTPRKDQTTSSKSQFTSC